MDSNYQPPALQNWKGRNSTNRAYIHENVNLLDLSEDALTKLATPTPVLLGYACDEGVRRNLGRPGAGSGPEALRMALGKMPLLQGGSPILWDAGDIICMGHAMEAAQEAFGMQVGKLVSAGYLPMAIGGGHDIAYGHYLGLWSALGKETRLGILNFDAHFDLREPEPLPHSGSPFLQIARHCAEHQNTFRYACIGVRKDANPQELWEKAASLETMIIPRESMSPENMGGMLNELLLFLESIDALYMTIDLDGFSSAYAPGVSAASPMGYSPESLLPFLELILTSGKLISMDIAELNPLHDRDGQTAILAASLIHRVLHHPGLF